MKKIQIELSNGKTLFLSESDDNANKIVSAEMDEIAEAINQNFVDGNKEKSIQLYRYYSALFFARATVYGSRSKELKKTVNKEFISYIS